MSKKKRFLGLFAILFVAIFAAGCVFATACGKKNKEEDETPHSHSYTSTVTKDPTCTEEGETTYTCDCGDTYTETIPATGHSYTAAWTWEGDEETGYTGASVTLTCSEKDSTVTYEAKDVTFTAPSGTIYGTYTASVTVDGKTYSDSKTVTAPSVTEPAEEVSYNIDFSVPDTYSWIGTPDTEGTTTDGTTFQYLTVDKTKTYTTGILTYMPYTGSKDTTINKENAGALYTAYATSSSTGSYFVLDLTGYEGFYVTITAKMSNNSSNDSNASIYVSDTLSANGANSAKSSANDDYQTLTYYSDALTATDTALYITWDTNIRLFTLDIAVTKDAPEVGHTHVYGDEPEYGWTSDGNGGYTVVGTLTCTAENCDMSDGYTLTGTATVAAENVTTVAATCTTDGSVTCSATVSIGGTDYTAEYEETIDALGHDYPDPNVDADKTYIAWGWTSRGDTTVSLQITCKRCSIVVVNENVAFTETAAGALEATYTVEGGYTYTDTYEIPETEEHEHNYQITAWNWATDYSSCTVTVTCSSKVGTCDKQTDTLTATVTSGTTTTPTCATEGEETYTATVTVGNVQYTDTKTAEIEALGHDYDTTSPSWEWTFDTEGKASATLSFVCKNDSSHVWSQEADQIEAVEGVYTATITGPDGQSYSDTATAPVVTEKETELHIDFSNAETYSWIETEAMTYKPGESGETTYTHAVSGTSSTDGGLLTVAGTTNNTSSTPMDIGDKSSSAMTTGGKTQDGGRYFMIDLTGFEGKYVSISVVVSGTGTGTQSAKSVILSTIQYTTSVSDDTLKDVTTSTSDVHQTLEYGALITAENNVLYLTWSDSVRIYTIDIIVSDEAPAEATGAVATADELLAALENGEGTITLTEDIALENSLQISSDVTIDLNGHGLSIENAENGKNTLTVSAGATVTITGGTISNSYTGASSTDNSAVIYSEGTLVLDGVTIESSSVGVRAVSGTVDMTNTTIGSGYWAVWESAGVVTVTLGEGTVINGKAKTIFVGGDADFGYGDGNYQVGAVTTLIVDGATITSNGESAISTFGTATSSSAIVVIKSGEITGYAGGTSACPAVYIPNGTLYVLGGTIMGSTALEIRGGTAYIYGGEFISSYTGTPSASYNSSGATSVGYALTVYPYKSTKRDTDENFNNDVAVYVSGGTFTGAVYAADVGEVGEYTLVISGGYFEEDPSEYVDTDVYNVVTVDDGELGEYYKVLSLDGLWGGDAKFSVHSTHFMFKLVTNSNETIYLYADATITVADGTFSLTLGSITAADSNATTVAGILDAVLGEYGLELTAEYSQSGNTITVEIDDEDFGEFTVTATIGCDADGDYISVSFQTKYELDIGTTIEADLTVENQKVRRTED